MKIQLKFAAVLMLATVLALTACGEDSGGGTDGDPSLTPSTIVFAEGAAVTKQIGSGTYTNIVSGDGTGAITYTSGTPGTATVNASTGEVTLIAVGTTVITAVKAATTMHETVTNTYTLTVTSLIPSTIVFADGASVTKQIGSGNYTNAVSGDGTGAITYTSGTPGTATINDSTGELILVAVGTTAITAEKAATTTHSTVTNTFTLTVTALTPSTIVFADGTMVTKWAGSGAYTNTVSGVGTGTMTYNSGTPETATVNPATGEVTIVAAGTTLITAGKAAAGTYASVTRSYTLTVLGIGSAYQGGKIAYILQPGDNGYDAAVPHGLIAATADQSTGIIWTITAYQVTSVPGTLTTLGSGLSNTNAIFTQNGEGSTYAAGLARSHAGGYYLDWYLPSQDELNKLYISRVVVGGFAASFYWSSSEYAAHNAWGQSFFNGSQSTDNKISTRRVRAVRAF